MFGDSLYIAGLSKALSDKGFTVSIATREFFFERYKSYPFINSIINLDAEDPSREARELNPDIAIDLSYAKNHDFEFRMRLLACLDCYCIATADYLNELKAYDEMISYRNCKHFSECMAKVYERTTGAYPSEKIRPYIFVNEKDLDGARQILKDLGIDGSKGFVYLNTKARTENRDLSTGQIKSSVEAILARKLIPVIYAVPECSSMLARTYGNRVKILPKASFSDVCALISKASAVITPDTSVTHIASCFNIPTLTFYRGNCLDYFKCRLMKDVWSSMSDIHMECCVNAPNFKVDRFGYPNFPETPVSDIPEDMISEKVKVFLEITRASKDGTN